MERKRVTQSDLLPTDQRRVAGDRVQPKMGDEKKEVEEDSVHRWGAKLRLPVDCPDNIGRDAVETSKKFIQEMNDTGQTFEQAGLDVVKKIKNYFDEKYVGKLGKVPFPRPSAASA